MKDFFQGNLVRSLDFFSLSSKYFSKAIGNIETAAERKYKKNLRRKH